VSVEARKNPAERAMKIYKPHRIPHHMIRFHQQMVRRTARKPGWYLRFRNLKYLPAYLGSRIIPANDDSMPWLNYELCDYMKKQPRGSVIEFGAGRSTVWLARHGFRVLSVEHQKEWAGKVRQDLRRLNLESRVELHLVETDPAGQEDPASYLRPALDLPGITGVCFILVDGIFRNECLEACAAKFGRRTPVLLHDSDWPGYQPTIDRMAQTHGFRIKDIFGPGYGTPDFTSATIFDDPDQKF